MLRGLKLVQGLLNKIESSCHIQQLKLSFHKVIEFVLKSHLSGCGFVTRDAIRCDCNFRVWETLNSCIY